MQRTPILLPPPPAPGTSAQPAQIVLDADRGIGGVDAGRGGAAHKVGDHGGGVDGPVALGASQGADLAAADLAVADDGRVGLGAAPVGRAVARGAVGHW